MMKALLGQEGLSEATYSDWQADHHMRTGARLAEGAAEHIAYFLLQSKQLSSAAPVDPLADARRYFHSLAEAEQKSYLAGKFPAQPLSAGARARMEAFWNQAPRSERHRILREMATALDWPPQRVVQTAYRFLLQRAETDDTDALYQARGLSADPFPPSMQAVEQGLRWLRANGRTAWDRVLLAGPGADFGSRFGVDDSKPVRSPQPAALLKVLPKAPSEFQCVDIRPEVELTLAGAPCRARTADLVVDRLPREAFDLAVATNVFVYLDNDELALALENLSDSLRPGGCLLHNDNRFATRLFGEAAGIPVALFERVTLGRRNGREQVDRIVVQCKGLDKR